MLTLDARLAWVVRVQPDELLAHIEVFAKLKPTLDALRACSRFGKGENVHVTKLPPELVERIGSFLTEPERAKARKQWNLRWKCFTGKCQPTDHYTKKEQLAVYKLLNEGSGNLDDDSDCEDDFFDEEVAFYRQRNRTRPLKTAEMEFINNVIGFSEFAYELKREGADFDGVEVPGWLEIHDSREGQWWRVNTATHGWRINEKSQESHRKNLELFTKEYGLEVLVCHEQKKVSSQKNDLSSADLPQSKALRETVAYLLLPAGGHSRSECIKTWYDHLDESDEQILQYSLEGGDDQGPTMEMTKTFDMTMPQTPSEASFRRFPRAVKTLGLVAKPINSIDLIHNDEEKSRKEVPETDLCQPVLKLLARMEDDGKIIG